MDDDVKIAFSEFREKIVNRTCVVCERERQQTVQNYRRIYRKVRNIKLGTAANPIRGWSDTCRSCEKEAAEIAAIEGEG